MDEAWLAEVSDWLRIPSVSADPAHADDVRAAGQWLCDLVQRSGGECALFDWEGHPLAVGGLRASRDPDSAPTVLLYGHFDVQPPAPLDLWHSAPFEPTVADGWLVARGVADDKGQVWMLAKAACTLAEQGELPVNVRFACDGEEETGGHSIVDWIAADEEGADACVIFDSAMVRRGVPAFNVATRGLCYFHVRVRTGDRDYHSGIYGGAALNATHALMQTLGGVLHRDGRAPEPLRAGAAPPTEEELEDWRALPSGAEELAHQGARPADERAAEEFYVRTWAEPSVDVHGLVGGEGLLTKTVLPVVAEANVSIRLAPGQSVDEIAPVFERLLREAAPPGADLEIEMLSKAEPGLVSPHEPVVELALDAFERVLGARPVLIRSGGSLPLVPALAEHGIPALLSGFALPESNIHAPNERIPVDYLELGVRTAQELLRELAQLEVRRPAARR